MKRSILLVPAALAAALLAGCGGSSSSTSIPSVSLYVLATPGTYEQTVSGAKLALAEAGGRAAGYRVSLAAQALPRAGGRDVGPAVEAARLAVADRAAAAWITDDAASDDATIPLLNTAGVPVIDVSGTQPIPCRPALYPSGSRTALTVRAEADPPPEVRARFVEAFGVEPTAGAWRAYRAAKLVIAELGAGPAKLDREVLAAALTRRGEPCV